MCFISAGRRIFPFIEVLVLVTGQLECTRLANHQAGWECRGQESHKSWLQLQRPCDHPHCRAVSQILVYGDVRPDRSGFLEAADATSGPAVVTASLDQAAYCLGIKGISGISHKYFLFGKCLIGQYQLEISQVRSGGFALRCCFRFWPTPSGRLEL